MDGGVVDGGLLEGKAECVAEGVVRGLRWRESCERYLRCRLLLLRGLSWWTRWALASFAEAVVVCLLDVFVDLDLDLDCWQRFVTRVLSMKYSVVTLCTSVGTIVLLGGSSIIDDVSVFFMLWLDSSLSLCFDSSLYLEGSSTKYDCVDLGANGASGGSISSGFSICTGFKYSAGT